MIRDRITTAVSLFGLSAMLFACACTSQQESGPDPEDREVGETSRGVMTIEELDGLTRVFADRYVGRLYSAVEGIRSDNENADERRRAQNLLTDIATNIYDIASNADIFVGVLDLLVVTTLAERVWVDAGRAEEMFGDRSGPLERAMRDGAAGARTLAAHVLDESQFDTVDGIIDDWVRENPEVDRVSFVRFENFAMERGTPHASEVLSSGGLFAEIGEAGRAIDDARRVAERVFFRAKQESTLLRWQSIAVKEDVFATPEYAQTLGNIRSLTEQIEGLPDMLTEQREGIMGDLDERFERADRTIDNARAALEQANAFTDSIVTASESVRATLEAGEKLADQIEQSRGDGASFDLDRYERAAAETTRAARQVERTLASAESLLASELAREGAGEIGSTLDTGVEAAGDEGRDLIDALFWRGVILLGLLLVVLVLYRLIAILMTNRLARY